MNILYESSKGSIFDLLGEDFRATRGSFHTYKWKASKTALKNGDKVYGFEKESITYTATVSIRGKLKDKYRMLNEFRNACEFDVVSNKPGKVRFGDYYIECFITKSETGISQENPRWASDDVEIYCPYPYWIKDTKKELYPSAGGGRSSAFLDYPFEYEYDYTASEVGVENWFIDHYTDSNFDMIIYGPCTNPRIVINAHVYQVNDTLAAGEYITVNSREKTVIKHLNNGTTQNIFNKRNKESSLFEKIPAGDNIITWSGDYGVDIIAHIERSEPEWI